jgi:hypothetical protein
MKNATIKYITVGSIRQSQFKINWATSQEIFVHLQKWDCPKACHKPSVQGHPFFLQDKVGTVVGIFYFHWAWEA